MTRADFDTLVRQLSRKLYGFAFRILRNQEEAEDAVQEIFIRLWTMKERLKEYSSINALATTMTKNYCIDQIRKRKHLFHEEEVSRDIQNSGFATPHEILTDRESVEILHQIIEQLPELYKVVIRLREIEGLSYEEIACKTEQNINTLRVTLSRARKMIREKYIKHQYERRGIKEAAPKVL